MLLLLQERTRYSPAGNSTKMITVSSQSKRKERKKRRDPACRLVSTPPYLMSRVTKKRKRHLLLASFPYLHASLLLVLVEVEVEVEAEMEVEQESFFVMVSLFMEISEYHRCSARYP